MNNERQTTMFYAYGIVLFNANYREFNANFRKLICLRQTQGFMQTQERTHQQTSNNLRKIRGQFTANLRFKK